MTIRTADQYRTRYKARGVARRPRTRLSDHVATTAPHREICIWVGPHPGGCGTECACGVAFDGFDTLGEASLLLALHIARSGSPNHAARAVSIDACFPLAGRLSGGRPGHPGHETKTPPMDRKRRLAAYQAQNGGGFWVTPRQYRRIEKHHRRSLRPAA